MADLTIELSRSVSQTLRVGSPPVHALLARVDAFVDGLLESLAAGGGHGGSGGAVGLEIERRWRLSALPPALAQQPGARELLLDGGYVPGTLIFERLRRVTECSPAACSGDGCACAVRHLRTVKAAGRLVRVEAEESIGPALFAQLWAATEGHRVRKRRFVVPVDGGNTPGLAWELDEVLDGPRTGLVLLEIELGTAAASPPPFPDWLAPFVLEDVTETFSSSMLVGLGGDATSVDAKSEGKEHTEAHEVHSEAHGEAHGEARDVEREGGV
jgi:CYTH domain-containing protein